jgi:hypothetical protein
MGAAAAFAGVVLLVRRSPFPLPIRLILPFTFFLFYQYAVVARSYNLLLLLLGLVALAYPARVSRPYHFIAAATLLAHVSVHAFFLACAIVGVSTLRLLVSRRHLSRLQIRRNATALAIFAASAGLLVAQLWPVWDVWTPPLPVRSLRHHLYDAFSILDQCLTEITWLTVLVLGISILWFWRRKVLAIFLLGLFPLFLLFESRYYTAWHQGIVFLFWLFCLWLSFERSAPDLERPKASAPLPLLVGLSLFAVAAIQADWSFRTARFDWTHPYSGSRDLALYLKDKQLEGRKIFAKGYATFAVQPYFHRNLFANFQDGRIPAAFHWSRQNGIARDRKLVWIGNPDLVVFSLKLSSLIPKRMSPDYRLVKIFPGNLYWKTRIVDTDAFALFERKPEAPEKEGPKLIPR